MARVYTQEQREELKTRIVELVRESGRETQRQLESKTGTTRHMVYVLVKELVLSGAVYGAGYGVFPSEQAHKDWVNARKKMSKGQVKKKTDNNPICSLQDGEIRHYDRRHNTICRECRASESMQRVLMFYGVL